MGNELAMFRKWDERREPDWDLLQYPAQADFHDFMIRLNRLYLEERALWEADDAYFGKRKDDPETASRIQRMDRKKSN